MTTGLVMGSRGGCLIRFAGGVSWNVKAATPPLFWSRIIDRILFMDPTASLVLPYLAPLPGCRGADRGSTPKQFRWRSNVMTSSTFLASDGDGYELQMGRWSRRLAPQFIEFAGIKDADCVLDVGCGTGSLTLTLAGNAGICALHGIDFSGPYIAHAKRSTSDARVQFEVGDACSLPFASATVRSQSFDAGSPVHSSGGTGDQRDASRHPSRWDCCGCDLGSAWRLCLFADVLGHRSRA